MRSKKLLLILPLFFIFLLSAGFVFAQRELEVPLPQIGEATISETPLLPEYVKYIFNFSITIAGLVAFLSLIYGGVRYLTSAGNPATMSDARDQIFAGIIGLIVILGSWVLLTTINPQLVVINPQLKESELTPGITPGIYLCRDAGGANCEVFTNSTPSLGELNDSVASVKFVNPDNFSYGAVLHEHDNYEGKIAVCLGDGCNNGYNNVSHVDGVSSVTLFVQSNTPEGEGVTLYEIEEYNKRCGNECYQVCSSSGGTCGDGCTGLLTFFGVGGAGHCWGPFQSSQPQLNTSEDVWSIEINSPGKWLAALCRGDNYQGDCEVFTTSDPNFDTGDSYLGSVPMGSVVVLSIR